MDPDRIREGKGLIRPLRLALLAALGAASAIASPVPASAALLEYLYVEPNAGVASGGHVALRLGDHAYHYQNSGGDILRLHRERFDFFRYRYSVLQNRTIHVGRLELTEADAERTRARFEARHLAEGRHFALQDALRRDEALLDVLDGRGKPLAAPGAGFFDAPPALARSDPPGSGQPGASRGAGATRLTRLRERIQHERGPDFLRERIESLEDRLRELSPAEGGGALPRVSAHAFPITPYTFSERFSDWSLERLALLAIEEGRELAPRWVLTDLSPELSLPVAQVARLDELRRRLEDGVVSLLDSRRPDRGSATLLSLARIAVLCQSVETGRLVVLDAFPSDAPTLEASAGDRARFVDELRREALGRLRGVRERVLAESPFGEAEYSELEDATNRFVEFERGMRDAREIRVHAGHLVPEGAGALVSPARPKLAGSGLRQARARARDRSQAHSASLRAVFGYDLISHNCVTALFDTIDSTLDERQLGGPADGDALLGFIPAISFRAMAKRWTRAELGEIPSFRRSQLRQMAAQQTSLWSRIGVHLRESNTFSSTRYRRTPNDSFFVFFTDATPPLRPIYGAANLAAGLAEATLGLFELPVDRGARLKSGAMGAFFSLPELAFVNLRKGSFEYARSEASATAWRGGVNRSPRLSSH